MGLFNWFKGKKKNQNEENVEAGKPEESFLQERAEADTYENKEQEKETIDEIVSKEFEERKQTEETTESNIEQNEKSILAETVENQLQKESYVEVKEEVEQKNVIDEVRMESEIKSYIDNEVIHKNDNQELSKLKENIISSEADNIVMEENILEEASIEGDSKETQKEKKRGFFQRLVSGLTKTRNNIVSGIDTLLKGFSSIDDDFYEELEEILIMGDLGVNTTMAVIEDLKEKVKEQKIKEPTACKALLIESIKKQMEVEETAYEFEHRKSVILLIGVNGVGKTTTIGKLSGQFKQQGKKVMVAAADTFRAAAIDQLSEWAKRANVEIIAQQEGSDPAAVVYDAVAAAKARNTDILLCDTAGRLHNKKNLMEELRKINRVIDREYPDAYKETLVVLDGTTGQNALAQAKQFNEVAEITGIVLTKLDGTAKGGIAIAIQSELGIPVKYIGIGEKIEDLQKFNSEEFVNALFDMSE